MKEVPRYPGGVDLNWISKVSIELLESWLGRPAIIGEDYPTKEQIEQARKQQQKGKQTIFDSNRHDK